MSSRDRILLLTLGGALGAAPLAAQSYSDPGPGGGVHVSGSRGIDAAHTGFAGGAQARFRLTGGLGLELLATYRMENQESGGVRIARLTEIPIQASLLFFLLSSRRVQPYVTAGGGFYRVSVTGAGPNESFGTAHENNFGLHGGVGVDVRTSLKTSVFADARYVFLDVDSLKTLAPDRSSNFVQISTGLNVYF